MRFRRRVIFIRKKAPLKFRTVLILSFIIFSFMTVISLYFINASIKPIIMDIANLETQKVATSTINYSLNEVIKNVDTEEFIIISKDKTGTPASINFDSEIYSQVLAEAVANAQKYLKALEEGKLHELVEDEEGLDEIEKNNGIIHYIPLGAVTKNAFFSHLGPKIPVKFTTIGDVDADISEEIKSVGINNTWISLSVELRVQIEVIIPFATEMEMVSTTIPVGKMLVPGEVPQFYSIGQSNNAVPAFVPEK